jgi:4-amino-4-deoxy-L-arabinose transferase-like glycosyltransferase
VKQRTLVGLLVVVALALVLRVIGLSSPFWGDEVMTVRDYVRLPVLQIVTTYAAENQHPLYSLLAHFCVAAFGEHEWTVRLPALLFGVAGVAAVFRLARRVLDERGALLAALLLAVSGHAVWFAQDARGYTGLLFFFALATTELLDLLGGATRGAAWRYSLWFALASWTHLTALFAFLGHALVIGGAWLLARRRATPTAFRSSMAAFAGGGLLTLLLYAPMASDVLHAFTARATQANATVVKVTPWTRPSWLLEQALASFGGSALALVAAAAAAALALVGVVALWRGSRAGRLFVLLHAIAPPVALAVLLLLHRHLYPRFFFFEAGFAAVVLVRGAQSVGTWLAARVAGSTERRASRCGVAIALLLAAGAASTLVRVYAHPKQDFVGALQFVEASAGARDAKAAAGGPARLTLPGYYAPTWRAVESARELAALRAAAPTTWVVYTLPDQLREESPEVAASLERDFDVVRAFPGSLGDGTVYVARSR